MCRNIRTLFNFAPPATDDEIRAASLQFVRKLSGFAKPSGQNEGVFAQAVDEVTEIARHLIRGLVTTAPPKDRDTEIAKARERNAIRFGRAPAAAPAPARALSKPRPAAPATAKPKASRARRQSAP